MTLEAPRTHPIVEQNRFVTKPWLAWFKALLSNAGFGSLTIGDGVTIDEFSDDDTMAGDSDTAVPTEGAVVGYLRKKKIEWDEIEYTDDADGDITQVLYKRDSSTVVTDARTYTGYGNISTQILTGEVAGTWTYSYDSDNRTVTGVVKS